MIVVGPEFLRERLEQRRRMKQCAVSNSRGADSDCSLSGRGWSEAWPRTGACIRGTAGQQEG